MYSLTRHHCDKPETDPTYSKEWSGVTGAPHCRRGCKCPKCGERLHLEEGNHYCPRCDDYVSGIDKNGNCHHT